ncbi:DTW domain-containing protein [Labilibaculum sp. DW002]|uniref:tRNA-uridine aminocarboxypropyltransferase n=1 Tax=Paralabilibaculum antarcticum TaxID=2912572 RepID=A0ABT5VRR1_9BACT|nr:MULTISPECIES: tRNA-uridine aminocarboxypropyltransferase [unclassified Labilibaculum]MBI9059933.1 DTW domain-containing protein [Labilibaculum sp.]MDE5416984.1 DTW domain-containing protein [Labilibaculum sp. DW002]
MQVEIKNPRIKCYKCNRPSSTCICKHISPFQTKTRFIILMHPKEYKKEKNGTGHMTNLQLENSEIIVGVDFTNNKRVNEILNKENSSSFLLYPGEDNFNLSIRKSSEINSFMGDNPHIFILDGTWPCARKMLKLSKNLQKLKRVSFDNEIKSKFIIKQQPEPLCLSTIESTYTVLNLLKEGDVEQCETKDFLIPFEKMIEHQVEYILNPNINSYRPSKTREIIPKDRYKKRAQRSIFFKQE